MPANADIDLELEPGPCRDPDLENYYPTGGTIRGRVRVLTNEPFDCRGVLLRLGWNTQGRGDEDHEDVVLSTLFAGTLPIGESEYEFEAKLPSSPISYAGHYINVIWSVEARLDLAWKRDPKIEKVFYVTPREITL